MLIYRSFAIALSVAIGLVATQGSPTSAAQPDSADDIDEHLQIVVQRQCELDPRAQGNSLQAQAIVDYAYCLVLGREPDGAGRDSWSGSITHGTPVEQVLIGMMQSEEFSRNYNVPKLSPAGYATLLHRLLLGSDPTAPALKSAAAVAERSHEDLQRGLIGSSAFQSIHPPLFKKVAPVAVAGRVRDRPHPKPEVRSNCNVKVMKQPLEFERDQVLYSFCLVLGRWPDGYGLRSWTGQLLAGMSLEDLLLSLLQSDEFESKYEANSLDNSDFMTLAYRLLLGREPDNYSAKSYVARLSTGDLSRPEVYRGLIASDEFHGKRQALFTAKVRERRAEVRQ